MASEDVSVPFGAHFTDTKVDFGTHANDFMKDLGDDHWVVKLLKASCSQVCDTIVVLTQCLGNCVPCVG